jgi:hypothetical protein
MENIVIYETFLILFRWLYSTLSHSGYSVLDSDKKYFQSKYFLPKDVLIKSNHTV